MRNLLGSWATNIVGGFILLVIVLAAAALLGNPFDFLNITFGK